ncbi:MAG: Unknown protein [uncultured Sulfurovum sp.]|uniref:Histidine kinase domain-containing protein n=1 Tax=uncultured Sulfurovum sp. TaxID=269237 RepID=A0A6S6T391_9BACT|nr:MAG: Unknown protein [uncultured Sulfurovum sp.]
MLTMLKSVLNFDEKKFSMSKSKEQCLNIISQRFLQTNTPLNREELILALEKSIKEISGAEYSLVWTYNKKNNTLTTKNKVLLMTDSILETVLLSKKVFFENYVQSHKKYNETIDNLLNIDIKSILIAPILDKSRGEVIGFISAFSSMENGHEFKRYDTRLIALLDKYAYEAMGLSEDNMSIKKEKEVKKEIQPKQKKELIKKPLSPKKTLRKVIRKTKNDLENELKAQEKKLIELEQLLLSKDKELKKLNEPKTDIVLLDEMPLESVDKVDELQNILDFLMNEVSYFSSEHHVLYTFLEMIKYSLPNKELLAFINQELEKSQLLNHFSDNLYNSERISKINEEYKTFEAFASVGNLYSKILSDEQITFNIFIHPLLPSKMILDMGKVQSIIVHLLNNVKGLIHKNGIAELSVLFTEKEDNLLISIKGIQPKEEKKVSNFFKPKVISNNLSSNSIGVGLSISSNLINILGAKLKLTTESQNEHSFTAIIPVEKINLVEKKKEFKSKKPIKIGILVSEENEYAYANLRRYLDEFLIEKSQIIIASNYKKISNMKLSHLICFDNLLTQKIDINKFPSVVILKYSDDLTQYANNHTVHEFSINSYYGMALQKILFPNIGTETLYGKSLLVEDTFWAKLSKKLKA